MLTIRKRFDNIKLIKNNHETRVRFVTTEMLFSNFAFFIYINPDNKGGNGNGSKILRHYGE